jgi:hypothetical protein
MISNFMDIVRSMVATDECYELCLMSRQQAKRYMISLLTGCMTG